MMRAAILPEDISARALYAKNDCLVSCLRTETDDVGVFDELPIAASASE
jgi:hypothetical protein